MRRRVRPNRYVGRVVRWVPRALTEVLLSIAGSNRAVLERAPRDRVKQAALGGAVLTTAALAGISATLALSMAFDLPIWWAAAGGLLWGLSILNLDRWLVVSTPRQKHRLATVGMAMPRFALALVIGLVVSTPLTLQIFDAEIQAQLQREHQQEREAFEQALLDDPRYAQLPDLQQELLDVQSALAAGVPADAVAEDPDVQALRARFADVDAQYTAAEAAVTCEKEGTCGSGEAGAGPASADKERTRDRLEAERAALQAQLTALEEQVRAGAESSYAQQSVDNTAREQTLQATIAAATASREADVTAHDSAVQNEDGLLARLGALEDLSAENPSMQMAHLALFAFLTAIECLPVLFKTLLAMSKPSLYEEISLMEDSRAKNRERYRLRALDRQTRIDAESTRLHEQRRIAAEAAANDLILEAQVEMTRTAVERWKLRQQELIWSEIDEFVDRNPVEVMGYAGVQAPRQRGPVRR